MPPCKYFEICQREIQSEVSSEYCYLHYPRLDKDPRTFRIQLRQYQQTGKSDFRYVTFPRGAPANFDSVEFSSKVDFANAVLAEGLSLAKAVIPHGLTVDTKTVSAIALTGAKITGPVTIKVPDGTRQVALTGAEFRGPVKITAPSSDVYDQSPLIVIDATGAQFFDRVDIDIQKASLIHLTDVTVAKGITIKAESIENLRMMHSKVLDGQTTINYRYGNLIDFTNSEFGGDISVRCVIQQELRLLRLNCEGKITISGECRTWNIDGATFKKGIQWEDSKINASLIFNNTNFGPDAELRFDGSDCNGQLTLDALPMPPKLISLNGTRICENVFIQSELGKPFIHIIADGSPPRLAGPEITLINVDLSQCRLVGNSIEKLSISNVKWARRWWRNVLYDELVMRKNKSAPWGNLKEACQILKQKYSTLGDHATSGDFHYGEMEAKRREYRWYNRYLLCPEFPYWLFSGYGIGYVRAFLWLMLSILGFGYLFYCIGGSPLQCNLSQSLLYSFQSAFLLRPTQPLNFPVYAAWAQAVESVVTPILAALFVFALNMRLKR